jgi:hypothetical protein
MDRAEESQAQPDPKHDRREHDNRRHKVAGQKGKTASGTDGSVRCSLRLLIRNDNLCHALPILG